MALESKIWTRVSFDEVVLEWCRAERDTRLVKSIPANEMPAVDHLLQTGDVLDQAANKERHRWLWNIRGGLLQQIPPDTEWYDVQYLTERELDELRVIFRCQWDDPSLGRTGTNSAVWRSLSRSLCSSRRRHVSGPSFGGTRSRDRSPSSRITIA
jgi:hypothetical protein